MSDIPSHDTLAKRLDVALAEKMAISRNQAQKLIKEGRILVNDALVSAHTMILPSDVITIEESSSAVSSTPHTPLTLDILFEDEHVLVVNKPAGILTHPTGAAKEQPTTLMDAAVAHIPSMAGVGGNPLRSGVVHRLDKDASGVVVLAKNEQTHAFLKEQFKNRETEKIYTVLVLGHVQDEHGTITFPIARSTTRGRMAARPLSQEGKEAITHYKRTTCYSSSTLLTIRIETGRTHQIRAHMFAIGHPVAGDTLYVHRNKKSMPLGRLFLHASSLTLTLPSGERTAFTAPLPTELQAVLSQLKPYPTV